jgi:hypothetical protein
LREGREAEEKEAVEEAEGVETITEETIIMRKARVMRSLTLLDLEGTPSPVSKSRSPSQSPSLS